MVGLVLSSHFQPGFLAGWDWLGNTVVDPPRPPPISFPCTTGTSPLYTFAAVFPDGAPNDENRILGWVWLRGAACYLCSIRTRTKAPALTRPKAACQTVDSSASTATCGHLWLGSWQRNADVCIACRAFAMIFWAITAVVMVKYIFVVLRADDNGEGKLKLQSRLSFKCSGAPVIGA